MWIRTLGQMVTNASSCRARRLWAASFGSFSHLERGDYKCIDQNDIDVFLGIMESPGSVLRGDMQDLQGYNSDWLGKFSGHSSLVLKPKTSGEVSSILRYCNDQNIAVVPQGGNTGLVGGSVPAFDEVIISMKSMNSIHHFDDLSGCVTCDAGCILDDLDTFLMKKGHCVPLDLGAKGSCHIGGNIATNAGGLRFLRYGSLHGSVLGLEVVLPDGTILDMMNTMKKDNTGYDLKQMFIGSEGTLGIITKLALSCPPCSMSTNLVFFTCPAFGCVTELMKLAKNKLGEILSAFEYLDQDSVDLALEMLPDLSFRPNASSDGQRMYYVVLETRGSDHAHDIEKLERLLESSMDLGYVVDGTLAQNTTECKAIWELRESVTEALRRKGATYKYDISVPTNMMDEIVWSTRQRMSDHSSQNDWKVVGYGHVADSNLHLNISVPEYHPDVANILEPWIYDTVASLNGSISAEHGIGLMKVEPMRRTKNPEVLNTMKRLKDALDPHHIMNPYKMLT